MLCNPHVTAGISVGRRIHDAAWVFIFTSSRLQRPGDRWQPSVGHHDNMTGDHCRDQLGPKMFPPGSAVLWNAKRYRNIHVVVQLLYIQLTNSGFHVRVFDKVFLNTNNFLSTMLCQLMFDNMK